MITKLKIFMNLPFLFDKDIVYVSHIGYVRYLLINMWSTTKPRETLI